MPYIKAEDRKKYSKIEAEISYHRIETKGDLEYLVFLLMKKYATGRELNYTNLHDNVYAVHHCAHEFERRYLDKREDSAMANNGDI